jgi:hypothetical protein
LPWHKAGAGVAYDHGRPHLIYKYRNLEAIMEDLIEDVRIDVDFLCREDETAVRKRVRDTLDVRMKGKGYCLGTGNTVNYMPAGNYLTYSTREGSIF